MAVAGLHNVSVFAPSSGDSQHGRPSKRASTLLQIWREIEGENSANESRQQINGSNSECLTLPVSVDDSRDNISQEFDDIGNQSLISSEMDHEDTMSVVSEQSSDLGETERERVRQVFREWMSSGSKDGFNPTYCLGQWPCENECDDAARRRANRRICGRQTLVDLLLRIQNERKGELLGLSEQRPVSNFTHRNRIQALLKGRFLRNERLVSDERPSSSAAATELGLLRQRHTVSDLREEFLSKLDRSASTSSNADSAAIYSGENEEGLEFKSLEREDTTDGNRSLQQLEVLVEEPVMTEQEASSGEEASVRNEGRQQEILTDSDEHGGVGEQSDAITTERLLSDHTLNVDGSTNEDFDSYNANPHAEEFEQLASEIEDEMRSWQQSPGASHDNIDDQYQVQESPQDWESNHTQEAVDSWLDVPSALDDDGDVRRMELQELFSRGRVSSLLRSDFRESLDRMLQSHTERLGHASDDWEHEDFIEPDQDEEFSGNQASTESDGYEPYPLAPSSTSFTASRPFWDEMLPTANWPHQISNHQLGTEWEVISELRVDMARLQRRMNNMQSMLEECMDMQIELQRSVRQEVSAALNRALSSRDAEQAQDNQNQIHDESDRWEYVRKGVCCLCRDNKIDSLLYRCGHMCTCSKCAENLIQHKRKCPMCQAPAIEVVRAYFIQ